MAEHVSDRFLNEKLCQYLVKLGKDPVPNIRFNVSKAVEQLYPKFSNSNKIAMQEVLEDMEKEEKDFDVKYYAEKALKTIRAMWMKMKIDINCKMSVIIKCTIV